MESLENHRVRLVRLVGAPELNGEVGIATKFIESSGRYAVRLSDGTIRSVKRDNLESVTAVHAVDYVEVNNGSCLNELITVVDGTLATGKLKDAEGFVDEEILRVQHEGKLPSVVCIATVNVPYDDALQWKKIFGGNSKRGRGKSIRNISVLTASSRQDACTYVMNSLSFHLMFLNALGSQRDGPGMMLITSKQSIYDIVGTLLGEATPNTATVVCQFVTKAKARAWYISRTAPKLGAARALGIAEKQIADNEIKAKQLGQPLVWVAISTSDLLPVTLGLPLSASSMADMSLELCRQLALHDAMAARVCLSDFSTTLAHYYGSAEMGEDGVVMPSGHGGTDVVTSPGAVCFVAGGNSSSREREEPGGGEKKKKKKKKKRK